MMNTRHRREMLKIMFLCIAWYTVSINSNVIGKMVLSEFPFPMTVTMVQLTSIVTYSAPAFTFYGVREYNRDMSWGLYTRLFMPIALGKFVSNVFNHVSIWKVPVSYAHTVKATMPLFTVILSRIILQEQQTWKVYCSLLPIVGGVTIATMTELSFNMIGLLSALGSTLIVSLVNIYSKKVLKETGIHHLRLLFVVGQLAAVMFLPIWLVSDSAGVVSHWHATPFDANIRILGLLIIDGMMNWLQNIFAFSVLNLVTPLTFAVANASKRIFIIAVTLLILGNPVTGVNIFGMLMAIFGVLGYNKAKFDQRQEESQKSLLPNHHQVPKLNGHNSILSNGLLRISRI